MGNLSETENNIYNSLHPSLKKIVDSARAKGAKFRLICGVRNKADQMLAYNGGTSRAKFGESPHNFIPALAFDFIPLDGMGKFNDAYWNKLEMFAAVANVFSKCEKDCDVNIVWGADWNDDGSTINDKFKDYPHIQLANWKLLKGKLAT